MTKSLVIIITFNPYGKDNNAIWENVINNWHQQRSEENHIDIMIADCISVAPARDFLKSIKDKYGLTLLFINDRFNAHVCVNTALSLMKENNYDYFFINTSDANLSDVNDLSNMIKDINHHSDTSLLVPTVDSDYEPGQRGDIHVGSFKDTKMSIQIIRDKNMPPSQFTVPYWPRAHLIMYDRFYMEKFGFKVIDITGCAYAQICTTTLLASIKRKGVVCHRVMLNHIGQCEIEDLSFYDFPMVEYAPHVTNHRILGASPQTEKPKLWQVFYDAMRAGQHLGCNYGHYLGGACDLIDVDQSAYDEQGYPKRADELYEYLKEWLFLKKENFDYDKKVKYKIFL